MCVRVTWIELTRGDVMRRYLVWIESVAFACIGVDGECVHGMDGER